MGKREEIRENFPSVLYLSWMKFSLAKENFPEIPIFCGVFPSRLPRRSLSF